MTLVKVIVMTIGEIDYNTIMVDSLDAKNPDTGAYLVPYKETSFLFMAIFIFAMPIILMNLLVSKILLRMWTLRILRFIKMQGVDEQKVLSPTSYRSTLVLN